MVRARRTTLSFALLLAVPTSASRAQSRPAGVNRPWVEFTFGGGHETQHCPTCARAGPMGGVMGGLSAGLTVSPTFGLALLGRGFREVVLDNRGHSSGYLIALGQASPETTARWLTLNLGVGVGSHSGDNTGSGVAALAGLALRLTPSSPVGLALDADILHNVTGHSTDTRGQPVAYHPTLYTIGLGINLAGMAESR